MDNSFPLPHSFSTLPVLLKESGHSVDYTQVTAKIILPNNLSRRILGNGNESGALSWLGWHLLRIRTYNISSWHIQINRFHDDQGHFATYNGADWPKLSINWKQLQWQNISYLGVICMKLVQLIENKLTLWITDTTHRKNVIELCLIQLE